MSDQSSIEWTDATWNPVRGCTKISPGCAHCYAETFAERFRGVKGHPFEQGFDLRLVPEALDLPLRWRKPRRIFVNSMSDLFHEDIPDEFIVRVFSTMVLAPRHTFQVLTKRAERMRAWVARYAWGPIPPHVWLGVSVEDQRSADERIPQLMQTPAAVRFVSAEPLLGPIDLRHLYGHVSLGECVDLCVDSLAGKHAAAWSGRGTIPDRPLPRGAAKLGWVIVGGESGPGARRAGVGPLT